MSEDKICARLEVVDDVFDEIAEQFPKTVEKYKATPQEAVLALVSLIHEVLRGSEIIEYVTAEEE